MRRNVKATKIAPTVRTHEGAPAVATLTPEQKLRRSVLSCLLWEKEFYEDGEEIADRIVTLAEAVPPATLAKLAVEARSAFQLRHAPLILLDVLTRTGAGSSLVSATIEATIQRADELSEFLAVYWRKGKHPLSKQVKVGLARAFLKFDEYQLAKYDRANAVRLRDVLFLARPISSTPEQKALWKRLAEGKLETPDTWEVGLSAGQDKKATFERLIKGKKLGYLALLRNLRNMMEAGCDRKLVADAVIAGRGGAERVLPFRYVAAARACPQLEPAIDKALQKRIAAAPPLPGVTVALVDVSGSMDEKLSARSDLTRVDAGAALASVITGDLRVFSFSNDTVEVPARRGMAGIDAVLKSQPHSGTYLGKAVSLVNDNVPCDRLIVITDEQSHDKVPRPNARAAYMINVASAQNGVGYERQGWTHIDGFSERVLRFIAEVEEAPKPARKRPNKGSVPDTVEVD